MERIKTVVCLSVGTGTRFSLTVLLDFRILCNTMATPENPRILALFDVDGTLTIPRGEVTEAMMQFMKDLSQKITVGIVGGTFT